MLGHGALSLALAADDYPDFGSSDGVLRVWDLTTKQLLHCPGVIALDLRPSTMTD